MDQIYEDQKHSMEVVWIKAEPTDIESTANFYIKSEDKIAPSAVSLNRETELKPVSIKYESILGDFECIPSSECTAALRNEEKFCSFGCDECGKKLDSKLSLNINKRLRCCERPFIKANEQEFNCRECGAKFIQIKDLQIHERTHIADNLLSCKESTACSYIKFESELGVVETAPSAASNIETELEAASIKSEITLGDYEFTPSSIPSGCTAALQLTNDEKFGLYSCDECGKKFNAMSNLNRHKLIHFGDRPFACGECEMGFTSAFHLNSHKLTHTGEKPFSCDECGMKFSQKCNLKPHKLTHTGEKPHSCEECGMKFSQKCNLKAHKLTHSSEKPYACDVCGMKFAHKRLVKSHHLTHTGEKRFSCDKCGKGFNKPSLLATHMMLHRGERPFSCDECGMGFIKKCYLTSHKLKHSGQ